MFHTKRYSLRRQLLVWVFVPMLVLITIDTTILYRMALTIIEKSYDRSLADTAEDLLELLKVSKIAPNKFEMDQASRAVILSDPNDLVYFGIYDSTGRLLAGDAFLSFAPYTVRLKGISSMYYSAQTIKGNMVRMVTYQAHLDRPDGKRNIFIQIAETMNKRNLLAQRILLGLLIPQILLILTAVIILDFAISRGLRPLQALNETIAGRSYKALSPINLHNVPFEVLALVQSINSLMEKLRNLLESQHRFIADAAHQLRTPLAGIQAQVELAQQENDSTLRSQHLAQVNYSMERLSHVVNQLLKLAHNQPETTKHIRLAEVDLVAIAKEVCSEMVPAAYKKNIDLGLDFNRPSININGDTHRLKILLQNLIDNAIRYTAENGKITVSVQRQADQALVAVEDNGLGIPLQEREKVFERFYRLQDRQQEGSGLGLAIVKEIVEVHSAEIRVLTPDTYQGTRFEISFAVVS